GRRTAGGAAPVAADRGPAPHPRLTAGTQQPVGTADLLGRADHRGGRLHAGLRLPALLDDHRRDEDGRGDGADAAHALPRRPHPRRLPGGLGPVRPGHAAVEHRLLLARRVGVLHGRGRVGRLRAVEAAAHVRRGDPGRDAGHADDPGHGRAHPALRHRRRPRTAEQPVGALVPGRRQRVQHLPAQTVLRLDPARTHRGRADRRRRRPAGALVGGAARVAAQPRRGVDRHHRHRVQGLRRAAARHDRQRQDDAQRRPVADRRDGHAERRHGRPGRREHPDDHRLLRLPTSHHGGPHRRIYQGMSMSNTWWRGAAIYQVYLRSFADGNGDGVGDLAGLRSRLPYLKDLGADAIWLNPWYPSPMADGGYDVADYRGIEPVFGTLAEAEKLIAEAHELDLKIIIDVVPNHSSTASAWFQEALADPAARDRFWFRDEPNDWQSIFGGPAWTQVPDGQWYLHLFAPEQPDCNWDNPEVHQEFEDVLRFWFDRGVDGVRVDSAALLYKSDTAWQDLDPVHDVYRRWRRIADSYGDRVLIGELWLPDQERFARYLRPDELHTAFNFDFLACPWDPAELRRVIDLTLTTHATVGAPPTWVLSNHDVTR